MYLQSLEMIGFKSFAPRTIFNFSPGVTAIVGPNGCGKSNVLDAMRWVLGEQSAKALRGGEMLDVIFSGTDSRPALGLAEVSLTFAECEKELGVEWNEMCVARRVYRDGKSEYFLNGTACRLRDIHELFMDTGVGRSAYSIMEQGKIDLILSSRPEDRRVIFEEAAGITKYKAQKKEALRKLDYTESNLLRVQDIMKEVGRQIGSLQRQAAKARRYQALMRDLKILDIHLTHKNYQELLSDLKKLRTELGQIDEVRSDHENAIAQREGELAGFRLRMEELDNQISGLRDSLQILTSRVFSAENRIATNAERSEEARSAIERHQRDIAVAGEKMQLQQDQIEQTDHLLAQMVETLREQEAALEEHAQRVREARDDRLTAERATQEIAIAIAGLDARLATSRGEVSAAAGRREATETRVRVLREELDAVSLGLDEAKAQVDEIAQRADGVRLAVSSAFAEQSEAQQAYGAAQEKRQEIETALNAASKEMAGIETRVEVLRQLQEDGEGFEKGTQAVLRGLDDPRLFKSAIQGALADLIQVEPRYIAAIEAGLGPGLEAIIFKDTTAAESALGQLKRRRLGRASVVPRDWISANEDSSSLMHGDFRAAPAGSAQTTGNSAAAGRNNGVSLPEEGIAWAASCVRGTCEASALANSMLTGVVVTETLDSAFRIKAANPFLAVATLAGEFISREGVVRGGQIGENGGQSALSRRAQISRLEGQLAAVAARVESFTSARSEALQAQERGHDALLAATEGFQRAQVENAAVQNEQKLAERQLAELESRRVAYHREIAQLEESLRAGLGDLQNSQSAIAEMTRALERYRLQRAEAESAAETMRQRETTAIEDLNEIRVRVATGRQQLENLNRQRGPMAARLTELTEILDARRTDVAAHESRVQSLVAESDDLRRSAEVWREEVAALQANVTECLSARSEAHEKSGLVEAALKAERQELIQLQDKKGSLEVRAAQLEIRTENLRSHTSRRYHADLEDFEPDSYALICSFRDRNKKKVSARDAQAEGSGEEDSPEPQPEKESPPLSQAPEENAGNIDWGRIEELVTELAERIEAMGPINLDAIQEYDELEQRQAFLEKQNADLVNSKAELHAVIAKINRTTRELFSETFEKIRENFQLMFSELFGGGRANLLLVEESDPLESGIEIIAKPPGKQLQSVSLLSGGERTMTAVSLLFAIYMVKPSPFCVLDEMDAPLDESNINRFVKILDRFVEQSQFIVITHNKRTISRADVLYGVTMEEQGISKLVSVKFVPKQGAEAASQTEPFEKAGDLQSDPEPVTA